MPVPSAFTFFPEELYHTRSQETTRKARALQTLSSRVHPLVTGPTRYEIISNLVIARRLQADEAIPNCSMETATASTTASTRGGLVAVLRRRSQLQECCHQ